MKRIYFSNSAFARGTSVFTDYSSGCFRNILVTANDIRTDIPEIYMINGALNEERFENDNLKDKKLYMAEQPTKSYVGTTGVAQSGRMDFMVITPENKKVIIELKNVNSQSSYKKHITGRYIKPENLAQLVKYMIDQKTDLGVLVYSFNRVDEDGKFVLDSEVSHTVRIMDNGVLEIGGAVTDWKVQDALSHSFQAAKHVADNTLGDRPANYDSKWASPCAFCTWKKACDKYDAGEIESTEEYLEACKVLAEENNAKLSNSP